MRSGEYRNFKKIVELADSNSRVWYDGYMWIDLTEAQDRDMTNLLKVHPCIVRDGNKLRFPSGIIYNIKEG